MRIIVDIIFGLVLPYAVLPALLIATIMKMRSFKLTVGLLVLVIAAFCYGLAIGVKMQEREQRREQSALKLKVQQDKEGIANRVPVTD